MTPRRAWPRRVTAILAAGFLVCVKAGSPWCVHDEPCLDASELVADRIEDLAPASPGPNHVEEVAVAKAHQGPQASGGVDATVRPDTILTHAEIPSPDLEL